jgi:hypothetical protein
MPRQFIARMLTPERVDCAYPIVRLAANDLSPDAWRQLSCAFLQPNDKRPLNSGIVTIEDDDGYVHGLCSYSVTPDLRHGPSLLVDNFIAVDIVHTERARLALIDAMMALARRLGCHAVHLTVPVPGSPHESGHSLSSAVLSTGERVDAIRLCKVLVPTEGIVHH